MKAVMVIDRELPLGLAANTAAVLGISLGHLAGDIIGPDVYDREGAAHRGITTRPIPILGGTGGQIGHIIEKLSDEGFADVSIIDFNHLAQRSRDYENYTRTLSASDSAGIRYLGICLYGPVKKVNKLTGSIGLLR
ncbi:MAG: DUF2000 domain-containing protein [Firmicutes bacterium]|nr:DUF2000 domain-containing protein [Bacillota bacterium]